MSNSFNEVQVEKTHWSDYRNS